MAAREETLVVVAIFVMVVAARLPVILVRELVGRLVNVGCGQFEFERPIKEVRTAGVTHWFSPLRLVAAAVIMSCASTAL
jgi:hypothetical protein